MQCLKLCCANFVLICGIFPKNLWPLPSLIRLFQSTPKIYGASNEANNTTDVPKRQIINPAILDHIELSDLVTTGSLLLLQKLNISSKFLEEDPKAWPLSNDYCEPLKVVNALTVTNDHAERKVALIEDYNSIPTL